jgi:pyruvate,water dikinase
MSGAAIDLPRQHRRRPLLKTFAEIADDDLDEVGGKALSLAKMTRVGLPVPDGFCLTCAAYRLAAISLSPPRGEGRGEGPPPLAIDADLRERLIDHYQHLGRGPVAVRSSATLEDGATASFAGQQETLLGVEGDERLIEAVLQCWKSLHAERAIAYRQKQGVGDEEVAMAVVVQRMVPSEVSGVLFTRDPLDPTGRQMLIEAAPGLGEAVVSGRVQPDRFHTDRDSGELRSSELHIGGATPSLTPTKLLELTKLGHQVEQFYGEPRDIEWAFAGGKFWLLQARPITTADAFEREQVRCEEIERLGKLAEASGTVWSRYNLAEVLPEPTPLTWSIIQRLISASGGFGAMYRSLGFDPDPCLNEIGFFDLICSRVYVNLSREPTMYFRDFPYGHDFAKLKENPQLASYPTPAVDGAKATWRTWLGLPRIAWKMLQSTSRMASLRKTHADRFEREIIPQLVRDVDAFRSAPLASRSAAELLRLLDEWIERTLVEFAQHSLQAAMFAAAGLAELEQRLAQALGDEEQARQQVRRLVSGARPTADCDLPGALKLLAAGEMTREDFMNSFGHRGRKEMELSEPRWREDTATLPKAMPSTQHANALSDAAAEQALSELAATHAKAMQPILTQTRRYLALREAGKHYLMLGYGCIREILLELDRRLALRGDIFYLSLTELRTLAESQTSSVQPPLAARKRRRQAELSLPLPPVIFSDDLEAIGRVSATHHEGDWQGTPLSFGEYEGPALVLEDPIAPPEVEPGYVLVCPSTDPAWGPLFLQAGALVMETGGVLSHGAIVAREFGLPAVAGLPGIMQQIKTGERIQVSGTMGIVRKEK